MKTFWVGVCLAITAHAGSLDSFETDWDQLPPAKVDRNEITPRQAPVPADDRSSDDVVPAPAATTLTIDIFKKPKGLNIPKEFMLVSVGGHVRSAHVISTATEAVVDGENKRTPEGSFNGRIETAKVKTSPSGKKSWRVDSAPGFDKYLGALMPFPFHASSIYPKDKDGKPIGGAPMYWAVHIGGGYWIHATPHYSELGRPASMGCVRTSYPSAMELFDLGANTTDAVKINIYKSGSEKAKKAFAALNVTAEWVRERVGSDLADALAAAKHEYNGIAHSRRGKPIQIPKCGAEDCIKAYGKVIRVKK